MENTIARWIIAGYEIMAMIHKGRVAPIATNSIPVQAVFVAALFGVAA